MEASNRFMMIAVFQDQIVGALGIFGSMQDFAKHNASLGLSIQNAFSGSGLGTAMMWLVSGSMKKLDLSGLVC